MTPWTDPEINRFLIRESMFMQRGCSAVEAEKLGDQLAQRDQNKDQRRMCIECKNLQHDGNCFASDKGRIFTRKSGQKQEIKALFECPTFAWLMPTTQRVSL
jgi:hypothetical protein